MSTIEQMKALIHAVEGKITAVESRIAAAETKIIDVEAEIAEAKSDVSAEAKKKKKNSEAVKRLEFGRAQLLQLGNEKDKMRDEKMILLNDKKVLDARYFRLLEKSENDVKSSGGESSWSCHCPM